ncbi:conserved hypothetical protein [Clostridium botulinum C str. Eklund]|nr:conserved hypothetical protein [Clostridium botulinum C str. Eklund]NEZ48827.1 carboxypeptidase regulatory-like domain-containing protein [Clostridium botulinum]
MSLSYVPIMHAITNTSGEYVLTNVPAGSYYLFSIAPGKQLSQLGPIEATNGTELTENFNLIADNTASLGVISGNISSSTGPVANAVLTLTQQGSPNTVVAVTYTNSQGNYAFTEVSPGTYNINVSAPGYISASGSATVTAGQIATLNEVLTASSGMAGGTVSGVITDNTGAAVVGANVILYSENTQTKALTPIQFTTSGLNGVYLFIGVGQGTYVIKANKNA